MTEKAERVIRLFAELGLEGKLSLHELTREFRFEVINQALQAAGGNQCKAAKILGIHRNTLARDILEMKTTGRLKYEFHPRYVAKKPVGVTVRDVRRIRQAG